MFSGYLSMLADTNGLGPGFWKFEPGMLFKAEAKWWGDGGPRDEPHNGLDLRCYKQESGTMVSLGSGSMVPVAADGEVVSIVRDFLGYSAFVAHGPGKSGTVSVSAYGHIAPVDGLVPGVCVSKGHIIGKLSEYEGMAVPPHLHVSFFAMPEGFHELDWGVIGQEAVFVDPLISFRGS